MVVAEELAPNVETVEIDDDLMIVKLLCPICGKTVKERKIEAKARIEEPAQFWIMAGLEDSESYWSHLNEHGIYFRVIAG